MKIRYLFILALAIIVSCSINNSSKAMKNKPSPTNEWKVINYESLHVHNQETTITTSRLEVDYGYIIRTVVLKYENCAIAQTFILSPRYNY